MDERRAVLERLLDVGDGAERLVVDLDQLGCVLRERTALRDDDRNAVALEARLVDGERVVRRHLDVFRDGPGAGKGALPVVGQVGPAEGCDDTFGGARSVEVHALDPSMRVRAADERHEHGARQGQVVDEGAAPAQERGVFLSLDGRADERARLPRWRSSSSPPRRPRPP